MRIIIDYKKNNEQTFLGAILLDGKNAAKLPSTVSGLPQIACAVSQ